MVSLACDRSHTSSPGLKYLNCIPVLEKDCLPQPRRQVIVNRLRRAPPGGHGQNHSGGPGDDVAACEHAFARRTLRLLTRLDVTSLVGAKPRSRTLHDRIGAGSDRNDRH